MPSNGQHTPPGDVPALTTLAKVSRQNNLSRVRRSPPVLCTAKPDANRHIWQL